MTVRNGKIERNLVQLKLLTPLSIIHLIALVIGISLPELCALFGYRVSGRFENRDKRPKHNLKKIDEGWVGLAVVGIVPGILFRDFKGNSFLVILLEWIILILGIPFLSIIYLHFRRVITFIWDFIFPRPII